MDCQDNGNLFIIHPVIMSVLEKISFPETDLPTIGSTQTTNCQKELTQNQIDILLAEAR